MSHSDRVCREKSLLTTSAYPAEKDSFHLLKTLQSALAALKTPNAKVETSYLLTWGTGDHL